MLILKNFILLRKHFVQSSKLYEFLLKTNFILQDFHEEYATEAFKKFDKDGSGFITAMDFQDIMLSIKSHLLTKDVRDNLVAVSFLFARLINCMQFVIFRN